MPKRFIALLLALLLIIAAAPICVGAAEEPDIRVSDVTVTAGNSFTLYVEAYNFQNVASLELFLYYDAEVLTLNSTSNGYMLNDTQSSVNSAVAGEVKLSVISLAGMNGTGTLLSVSFRTSSSAKAGSYPVKVAVGEAYSTSLSPIAVSCDGASVTVNERVETETYSIYGNVNSSNLSKGDVLNYTVRSNNSSYSFASADFTVDYDHEIFEFVSCTLSSTLTGADALYSVNSQTLGNVRISYVSPTPVQPYELFTVQLKVVADANVSTYVEVKAQNVYKGDLTAYASGSDSRYITIEKLPEVIDHPDLYLETEELFTGLTATSTLYLEKGAGIAAGDFYINYDPSVFRCVNVTAAEEVSATGGMIVINRNFSEGSVRFSYINLQEYDEIDIPLINIVWEPVSSPAEHYQLTPGGVGVVDASQNAITLEYVTDSDCIHLRNMVWPDCREEGVIYYDCYGCGDSYEEHLDPWDSHDMQYHDAKAATCTEVGWSKYENCTRCQYTTYNEIPALGHDTVYHEGVEVTCTKIGWESYETCNRCDYTTYVEIPALGHRVIEGTEVWAESITTENDYSYPFYFDGSIYSSTNKYAGSDSYFTITALYDCALTVNYSISSESGYDKLVFRINGSYIFDISGEISWNTYTIDLVAGDTLTLNYHKDGSVDRGSDTAWFAIDCEDTLVSSRIDIPTDELEATCTEAVICDYCHYVAKKALGHDEVHHEAKPATCTEAGWNAYVSCDRCGYSTYEELSATGHSYVMNDAYCDNCGYVRKIQTMTIISRPDKLEYELGEATIDLTGGVLYVTFEDGYSTNVSMRSATVSGFDTSAVGTKRIEVSYGNKTVVFDITVKERERLFADINGDGVVNGKDAYSLSSVLAGKSIFDYGSPEYRSADLDGDDSITGKDAFILKCVLAGSYAHE